MKPFAKIIGCAASILMFSSCTSSAMAGSKPSRPESGTNISSITYTQATDELFARGAMDENGHFFTHQELAVQQKVLTTQQLARLVLPSVVRLTVVDSQGNAAVQGSGFVVGKNMIATNVHVISGAHAITANFQNGRSEAVKGLVNADVSRDIALVYADTTGVRPLILAAALAQVGDPVVAVGSPKGLGGSISTGIVSGLREYKGSRVIQTTAPISPGSSGGALLNAHGQVLGITSFFYVGGQNLNFAYTSEYLHQILPYRAAHVLTWKQIEEGAKPTAAVGLLPKDSASAPSSAASESVLTEKPLAGLQGFVVVVSDVQPDAQQEGLDANQVKVEVELRLRKAGINVFDSLASAGKNNAAWLDVDIDTLSTGNQGYVFTTSARVADVVKLVRPGLPFAIATIWRTSDYGKTTKLSAQVNQLVDDEVDRFANDYLAQNPK